MFSICFYYDYHYYYLFFRIRSPSDVLAPRSGSHVSKGRAESFPQMPGEEKYLVIMLNASNKLPISQRIVRISWTVSAPSQGKPGLSRWVCGSATPVFPVKRVLNKRFVPAFFSGPTPRWVVRSAPFPESHARGCEAVRAGVGQRAPVHTHSHALTGAHRPVPPRRRALICGSPDPPPAWSSHALPCPPQPRRRP